MDLGIRGKVAFVEGSSHGMGRATAELLAGEGAKVAVAALAADGEAVDEVVAGIIAAGGEAVGVVGDLTVRDDVERAVAEVTEALGPPDIAVNNVGGPPTGNFNDVSDQAFVQALEQMTMSMVYLVRATLPHMREQKWGRYVTLNSIGAKEPPPELAHVLVNGARAAVISLNKTLSNEFAADGVTFNTIATGLIGTDRFMNYWRRVAEESGKPLDDVLQSATAMVPARRVGRPEEMAATIAFLCSDGGGYVNGELIAVDGGWHRAAY
jgi:3-oxoacyl-[acyl-carrier protein] reductase